MASRLGRSRSWISLAAGTARARSPVREVFPDASPVTYAARQRAFRQGRPTTGNAWHFSWTTAAGTSREADFRYIYQPLRNPTGEVEGLLLIASEKPQKK